VADPHVETAAPVSAADLRSQILASIPQAEEPKVETAVEEPTDEAVEEPADHDSDEADEDSDEAESQSDEDSEDESDEDTEAEAAADPKAAKGLDVVRRAEKRHRETMERDRAEFAREKEQHAARLTKLDQFEGLAKRVKYDPAAVLKALDVSEDDFELIAHAIFAESKAGQTDPKRKEAATHRLREREKEDRVAATEKQVAELRAELKARDEAAKNEAEAARFIQRLEQATAEKPLVAHMYKADPESVSDGFVAAYERLTKANKRALPTDVVAEFDRHERARLKKIGIDPDAIAKAKSASTANGKKTTTKVVAASNGNRPLTKEEILASIPRDAD
jgi:hypothetical protein